MGEMVRTYTERRWVTAVLAIALGVAMGSAQSGRRRTPETPPPSREPAAKPVPEASRDLPAEKGSAGGSALLGKPVPKGGEVIDRQTDQATATNRFALANGMTLIVRERFSQPLVSVALTTNPDGPEDWLKRALLARLSLRVLINEPASGERQSLLTEWRQLGAVMSSSVQDASCALSISVPRDQLIPVFEGLAKLFQARSYDASQVARQAALLDAELRGRTDEGARYVFSRNPDAQPTSASKGMDDTSSYLREIKPGDLHEFIQRTYRAHRVIISLVGAANAVTVLDAAQRIADDPPLEVPAEEQKPSAQNKIPARSVPPEPPASPPPASEATAQPAPLKILSFRRVIAPGDLARIHAGFKVTGPADLKDQVGLELLATTLGRGSASRLYRSMRESAGLVTGLSTHEERLRGNYWLVTSWSCDPKDVESTERVFFQQVDRLRHELLSPGEFQRALTYTEFLFRRRAADWSWEAADLAQGQRTFGDFKKVGQRLALLRGWNPQQLQQVAVAVLQYPNIAVEEFRPDAAPALSEEDFAARVVVMSPTLRDLQVDPASVKPAEPWPTIDQGSPRASETSEEAAVLSLQPEPVRDFSVLQGSRAFVREDRSSPLVTLALLFQGGRLLESPSPAGSTELMLRSLLRGATSKWFANPAGARQLYGPDLSARLEQSGAEIEIVNERDFYGLLVTTLSRNQEMVARLMVDMVERPTFDEVEVGRERGLQLLDERARAADSRAWSRQLALRALLGAHPIASSPWGTRDSLSRITSAQLKEYYQQGIARQFPLAIVIGDTDGSALISSIMAREFRRSDVEKSFKAVIPGPPGALQTAIDKRTGMLSHQTFALLGAPGQSADNLSLEFASAALFGPGGTIQSMTRDQIGVWVNLAAIYEPTLLPATLEVTMAHLPAAEEKIRSLVGRELIRAGERGLSETEWRFGKSVAMGEYQLLGLDPKWRLLRYARAALYGASVQEVDTLVERIASLTVDKAQPILSKYLRPDRAAWGVVSVAPY